MVASEASVRAVQIAVLPDVSLKISNLPAPWGPLEELLVWKYSVASFGSRVQFDGTCVTKCSVAPSVRDATVNAMQ